MTRPKVILINGPPGSGKDTLAAGLSGYLPDLQIEKFARPIRDAAIATFPEVTEENLEELKDKVGSAGTTLRKWMTWFSEMLMKPLYGKPIFGVLLAQRLKQNKHRYIVVSDSGFAEEARELQCLPNITLLLVRLGRKGKTFAEDSRSYITLSDVPILDLENFEGHPDRMSRQVVVWLRELGHLA